MVELAPVPDKVRFNIARMGCSGLEIAMFSTGWRLSPAQSKALLRAKSREQSDEVIASSISASVDALKSERGSLDDLK